MKKLFTAILLCAVLALPAAALTESETVGGWTQTQDTAIDADAQKAFDTAMQGFTGSDIVPEALLATQVVAGTNYCFLARVTPVVPDAQSHYALVYIYADLSGNAEITDIRDLEFEN